jgi:PIN domain nuclease of toxin-antitoxin system
MAEMNFLLDTCCFLWLCLEPEKLSPPAVSVIDDFSNELFLSDVSLWEVAMKNTAGKLPLPESARAWLLAQRKFHRLAGVPIRESTIYLTSELPLVHADPFDRLIAAQAIENDFTILSPDVPLSRLGAKRLW